MSSGGEDNEEYTVSPSSDGRTTQGGGSSMMFEYPTSRRESHPVRPFIVHNATAVPVSPTHRHAQDPNLMWNSGDPSCQPPPMMSQYNGSNFASNNGLSNTAARKASTMPHSPPWDIGTARSSATLRYTDRWTNMHHNDLLAMQASRSRPWSWGSLVYAMFVCGCCNIGGFCCGTIATVTAMTSYVDHKVGDYKRAAKKRRISLCLSSLGLIFGLSIIAVLLLLYFLLPEFNEIVNDAFTSVHTNIKKHNVTDTEGDNSPQSGT